MSRSKPIILAQSILTGLGILFTGAALADVVDPRLAALGALAVVAAKGGIDFYANATTTPSEQVVASQPIAGGPVLAGPATVEHVETGAEIHPDTTIGDVASIAQ